MPRPRLGTTTSARIIDPLLVAAACPAALAFGWATVRKPEQAQMLAAALLAIPLFLSPKARLGLVVLGPIIAFGGSDQLTPQKLMFLMGIAAAAAGAVLNLGKLTRSPAYPVMKPLLRGSIVFMGLIAASMPVATLNGTWQRDWMRDIAPYVLVATAPLFALDAATAVTRKGLERLLIAAGMLGAFSFAVKWLSNRGIAELPIDTIGFPTVLLGAALFALAMSVILQGHGGPSRWWWLLIAAVVFGLMVVTGTRSSLVLLAAPVAIIFGSRQQMARRSARLAIALPLTVVMIFAFAQSTLNAADAENAVVEDRISVLFETGDRDDHSYADRIASTRAGWETFLGAPLFGVGPGTLIEWTDSFGTTRREPYLDSPLAFIAKFGLFGIIATLFLVVGYVTLIRRLMRITGGPTIGQLALVGFGGIVGAWGMLQVFYEDKGFAAGLVLLIAYALRETFETNGKAAGA